MTAEYIRLTLLRAFLFSPVHKWPGKPLAMLETNSVHVNKHTFRENKIEKNPWKRMKISCVNVASLHFRFNCCFFYSKTGTHAGKLRMEREPPIGCSDSENEKSRLEVLESERNELQKSMMTLTSRLAQVKLWCPFWSFGVDLLNVFQTWNWRF